MAGENERIVRALMIIKSKKIDLLSENVRVCAMLGDLEPELRRERRRIKALYETGAVRLIGMAVAAVSEDEARNCLSEAAQLLIEEADMTYDSAAETVNYFAGVWYGLPRLKIETGVAYRRSERRGFSHELSGFSQSDKPSVPVFSDSVSAVGAEKLSKELVERYGELLTAANTKPAKAKRLCSMGMLILPYFPAMASRFFEKAVQCGGKNELSLVGRQLLSWHGYLGYEPALGFAMVKKAVDSGAKKGCLTLGYCYHNAVGICRCRELAEKYYLLAASLDADCRQISERYLEKLAAGEEYDDGLWRFY